MRALTMYPNGLLLLYLVPSILHLSAELVNKRNGSCFQNEQSKYHVFDLPCTSCHINMFIDCPDGTEKVTEMNGIPGCTYEQSLGPGPNITKEGCQHTCKEEMNVTSCCRGYWGSYCDECPGGGDTPCYNHGNCSDGMDGTGLCSCDAPWTGSACESCINSSLSYPNCTDIVSPVCNFTCPNNSQCVEIAGEPACMCEWPYVDHGNDDGSFHCKVVDLCTIPLLCHVNATCEQNVEAGEKNCTCNQGYHGDGYYCNPDDPCQIYNGGCEIDTTDCVRISAGKSTCQCKDGYFEYVPDYGCSLINVCEKDSCHPRASCTTIRPHTLRCTCPEGYVGNGHNCTGNILQTLKDLNTDDKDLRGQLNLILSAMEMFYKKELAESGPITVFVPINSGFKTIEAVDFQKWLSDEYKVKALLRQHILVGDHMLEYLHNQSTFYTLDGASAEIILTNPRRNLLNLRISGSKRLARLVKQDIVATNGIIHVTKKLLVDSLGEIGNLQMTADKYINSLHVYSLFNQFIEMVGSPVKTLLQQPGITVFAPPNEAWDKLPWDSLEFLQKPENLDNVEEILKSHIFNSKYEVVDFFNVKRLRSASGYRISVGEENGRFTFNDAVHITNADIVVENGLLMKIDAVMVPDGISTLPNNCDKVTYDNVMGPCGDCREEPRCSSQDVITNLTVSCEYYARNGESGQYKKLEGCAPMCNRTFIIPNCCDGFYGFDCLPCPGGYRNPCYGNGVCDNKTGECNCKPNFSGDLCSECEQANHYGPNCTQKCTCVKGTCSTGPSGDGRCHCNHYAIKGENCDKQFRQCGVTAQQEAIHCHIRAICWEISAASVKCMCDEGFTGDGETVCTEINPCQMPSFGGCHAQASCEKTGPGANNCTCNSGWVGDGTYCYPAPICRDHGNCHENAACVETFPGSHVCRCHEGYHGDGISVCAYADMCAVDNGGCHPKAKCKNTEPGRVNCTCMLDKGYSGNGYSCIANIFTTIKDNTNLTWISNIFDSFSQSDKELLLDRNYTVFAPHVWDVTAPISSMNKDMLQTLLNYHTLLNGLRLDMLVSLSYFGQLETMADGYYLQLKRLENNKTMVYTTENSPVKATVLQSDIICTNGYLNIIDKILMPYMPTSPDDYPDLETFFRLHPKYSIFGDWIMKKNLTDRLENNSAQYTLFVPTNSAMKHLKRTVTTEYLLYHVVDMKVMMASTKNGTLTTALGYRQQLDVKVYGWYNVTINGVSIVDQDIFTFGGLVNGIDGLLHPVLHKCKEKSQHVKYGACGDCKVTWSCDIRYNPYLENNGNPQPCKYQAQGHGLYDDLIYKQKHIEIDGCQRLCYRNKTTRNGCCSGYYGPTCAECPGGPEVPCSGHGQCKDGIKGNGNCNCSMGWTGYNCDSCMEGWTGDGCDFDMKSCSYRNGGCDMDAVCTMVRQHQISCKCLEGFTGDGFNCVGPCDNKNGGCHERAICSFKVATGVKCSCKTPFVGDGKTACNADIFSTLLTLHGVSSFIKSTRQLAGDDLSEEMKNSSYSRKITMFVPVDKGLPYPIPRKNQFQQQLVLGSVVLRNDDFTVHTLTSMAGEQLIVTFNANDSLFYVNDTYVIKGNIQCTNGIIHLMSGPFTIVTMVTPSALKSSIGREATVGISVTAAFLVILLTVGAVIFWIKTSRGNYWQILREWRSKQQHRESISQEQPLHSQEEKDDTTPCDTMFGNPLFLANNLE